MKRRPRRIESEVARHLTLFSQKRGCSPVERIPVLGRTGPDISINELELVVDVKSRKACPKSFELKPGEILRTDDGLIAVRLDELNLLYGNQRSSKEIPASVVVRRWLDHMDEWRQEHEADGISAIVLHRPGTRVSHAPFVIYRSERSKFNDTKNV